MPKSKEQPQERLCTRCESPLDISQAAHRMMTKLANSARPLLCAKCAVDGGKHQLEKGK